MFSRQPAANSAAPPKPGKSGPAALSFIGPEVVVSGDVATSAHLHVDGRIDGNVRCAQLCEGASGVYLPAEPGDMEILDDRDAAKRAALIKERLAEWEALRNGS